MFSPVHEISIKGRHKLPTIKTNLLTALASPAITKTNNPTTERS